MNESPGLAGDYFRGCECPPGGHVNDIVTATGEVRHQHDSPHWLTPAEQVLIRRPAHQRRSSTPR